VLGWSEAHIEREGGKGRAGDRVTTGGTAAAGALTLEADLPPACLPLSLEVGRDGARLVVLSFSCARARIRGRRRTCVCGVNVLASGIQDPGTAAVLGADGEELASHRG